MSRAGFQRLKELDVRRGTAKAIAHIGVEILLDGELARGTGVMSGFRTALRATPGAMRTVRWSDEHAERDIVRMTGALLERDLHRDSSDVAVVAGRLERALRGRRSLEVHPKDEPAVLKYVRETQAQVATSTAEIVQDLRTGLQLPALRIPADGE